MEMLVIKRHKNFGS